MLDNLITPQIILHGEHLGLAIGYNLAMPSLWNRLDSRFGYGFSVVAIVLVTLCLAPFQAYTNSTTVALAILVVILIVATVFGSRPALLASILGVLSLNYFFLPPLYTFTISDPQNWLALGAFFVTAIIAGQLSSYARRRADESESRRKEIERLYSELKDAFEQASRAEAYRQGEQLKSALLDAVTHDLRTPLTSIKASVTTLIDGASGRETADDGPILLSNESRDELLDIINEETDRLNEFIGGIVDLAKIEAGQLDTRRTWSELTEIIDNALERARIRLADHRVLLRIERELPVALVDGEAVGEVLYTFLDNAAKYSPKDSEIRISARRGDDETIEIAIEDKGQGIEPNLREQVFDKFFRASQNDIHATGSGLGVGLAIARGIAESQGGKVWTEDGADGFKTRFVFRFPIGDDEGRTANGG